MFVSPSVLSLLSSASALSLSLWQSSMQLSVSSNNLVDISAISSLSRLVTLNLQNNSITVIEGLDSLPQLEWLGLAGNSIKVRTMYEVLSSPPLP